MNFKETGFRPFYHHVCALELNDTLRQKIRNCPEADKSSHAVVYGYIDPEKGLMLEVLGAGTAEPESESFYFKAPYEGRRITISIADAADVPFLWFEKPEHDRFAPRLERLKQYDASEDVEKSRGFEFLDGCREPDFPDDIRVLFLRKGLDPEECRIRMTGLGEHVLVGRLLNQPRQDFGVNAGDTVEFFVHKESEDKIICIAEFEERKLSKADLTDGTVLKQAVADFFKDKNDDTFHAALTVLRSSNVLVPCEVKISEESRIILEQLDKKGKKPDSLTGEVRERFEAGLSFTPTMLVNNGRSFFPVFSGEKEMEGHFKNSSTMDVPFLHAVEMAANGGEIEGIVLNAFTQAFVVGKDQFDAVAKLKPLVDEEEGEERTAVSAAPESISSVDTFGSNEDIQIRIGRMDVFNYALYQNDVAPISEISILNRSGAPAEGLTLHIYTNSDFIKEYEGTLPPIPSGKPLKLETPFLIVNSRALADLNEAVNINVTVEIRKEETVMTGVRGQMRMLAYDQWQGSKYLPYLPAFIMPNHPAVSMLLHDASMRLGEWNRSSAIDGYQSGDPNRVRDLAAAAYAAIQKKNIVYATSPANLWETGQRIRTPEMIFDKYLGNCMDMTLLYSACIEAMGLNPVLILKQGHIYAGVWLKQRSSEELRKSDVIIEEREQLLKRINNGSNELTFVECTAMCSGRAVSFEEAENAAKADIINGDGFECAIDVRLARQFVRPIPARSKDKGAFQIQAEEKNESEITAAPSNLGISIAKAPSSAPKKITGKRELWESKLLDLSQHNMLLNLPLNASVMPLMSSHIDELEDALADGHEFHVFPAADWITRLSYTIREEDVK